MRKRLRIAAVVCCVVAVLIVAGIFVLWQALRYEPEFYRQALAVDPARQRRASHEMLQQISGLWSNAHNRDRWEVLLTAEQINGWLAVDLVENHPQVLPETLRDPRVEIRRDRITLACRLRRDHVAGVISLTVEPYLPEPNVLGLRICKARAGRLPWPTRQITEAISEAAAQAELPLRWLQADGDPVVLVAIPPLHDQQHDRLIRIETLRVGQGEVYLAGTSRPR